MKSKGSQPVHEQLEDQIAALILGGGTGVGEALPEVTDLALQAKVNPNAVVRAYAQLTSIGALAEHGGRLVVASEAVEILQRRGRDRFFALEMPELRERFRILGIDPASLDWTGGDGG